MVFLQLRDALELFVKGREFLDLPGFWLYLVAI